MGALSYRDAAATNTKILVRAGQIDLSDLNVANGNASIIYVQLFDSATTAAVTLGTTVADKVLKVEASVQPFFFFPRSVRFGQGLVYALTTTASGSTAPGAVSDLNMSIA